MTLSPGAFDDVLAGDLGQPLAWRQAFSCPCKSDSSGSPDPSCPICFSKGVFWADEVDGVCGLTNQTQSKAFAQFGEWQPGDALLTVPETAPWYLAGQYDRFRVVNSPERFSTVLIPGQNDKLLGTIISIQSVMWRASGVLVNGGIPTVNANGSLTFTSNAPPDGVTYVVNGTKYVEYFAYLNLPANRNVGIEGLPRKLPVRRFDLFAR